MTRHMYVESNKWGEESLWWPVRCQNRQSLPVSAVAAETAVTIFYSRTGRTVGEMGDNVIRVLTQMI